MDEEIVKSVKEVITEKYTSVNKFLDVKTKEFSGMLPLSRPYLYKLINHEVDNPGIKSLNSLADMVGVERTNVYKEYSE